MINSIEGIAKKLNGKGSGSKWQCRCPAHDDNINSLSIGEDNEKILVHCHAGCSPEDVITKLKAINCWPSYSADITFKQIEAQYDYLDENNKLRYQVLRYRPKGFKQRKPDPHNPESWIYNLKEIESVPYNLPNVLVSAKTREQIFIVEGEKDVESLRKIGLVATCNNGGAGKWNESISKYFKDTHVILIPDNDDPGRKHVIKLTDSLKLYSKSLKILELPNMEPKGDVTDWLNNGGDKEQLLELSKNAPSFEKVISAWCIKNKTEPTLICLADIESRDVNWLWHPYIPEGKLTLAEGDPGVGKSWFTMQLAAHISNGAPLPFTEITKEGAVIIFSAEDDPADTLKPRLEKLKANMKNIFVYPTPMAFDEKGLVIIEKFILEKRPALVIIDPLQCYLGMKDMNKANETRSVLAPLAELASKFQTTVLIVRHLKKATDKSTYRGMGSIDITAAMRSVLLIGVDPKDKNKRVIIHNKSNLAALGHSLGYTIQDGTFQWTGKSDLTAKDILGTDLVSGNPTALGEAIDFLSEFLAKGRIDSQVLKDAAAGHSISEKTLNRAKKKLEITSTWDGRTCYWDLPREDGNLGQISHMEKLTNLPLLELSNGAVEHKI